MRITSPHMPIGGQTAQKPTVKFLAGSAIRSEEQIAAIVYICSSCQWQIEWICEHPGCRPCKQRVAGGLKALIPSSYSHCAAGKW